MEKRSVTSYLTRALIRPSVKIRPMSIVICKNTNTLLTWTGEIRRKVKMQQCKCHHGPYLKHIGIITTNRSYKETFYNPPNSLPTSIANHILVLPKNPIGWIQPHQWTALVNQGKKMRNRYPIHKMMRIQDEKESWANKQQTRWSIRFAPNS